MLKDGGVARKGYGTALEGAKEALNDSRSTCTGDVEVLNGDR